MKPAPARDVHQLRTELLALLDVHPPKEWSPELLQVVIAVLGMYVREVGLRQAAVVLKMVPRGGTG